MKYSLRKVARLTPLGRDSGAAWLSACVTAGAILAVASCGGSETRVTDTTSTKAGGGDWQWRLPVNFPTPFVPKNNPMTTAKVELGRHLFYDKRLSVNETFSCASCHHQDKAFTDGRAVAMGATGEAHRRSSQGLVNVAYSPTLNWGNPAVVSLETQMLGPMFGDDPVELGLTDAIFPNVQAKFAADSLYQQLFKEAYPDDSFAAASDYSLSHFVKAIASFERAIISADSKYDRYLQDKVKLSAQEKRGMNLFFGEKAECFHCHGSFNFNDQVLFSGQRVVEKPFHNTGQYNLGTDGSYPEGNNGVFEITSNPSDKGKFRAPSLRNVAVTAPYNHDGSNATLQDVLANYTAGGRVLTAGSHAGDGRMNPNTSDLVAAIDLSKPEQDDIIAFLETLTDETLLTNPRFSNPFADPTPTGGGS